MTTTRPALWPLHDLLGTNMIEPEDSLYMQSGYPSGLAVPSGDHNGKFRRSGDWSKYLDLNGLRNDDWLDDGSTFLAYSLGGRLSYNNGGNVLGAGATVATRATYLINATRVETDTTFLNPVGGTVQGDPLVYPLATAPGRIWIYAKDDGTVRYDSVGVGVADSPSSDEITVTGVDIDATGAVTDGSVDPTTLALPDEQLGVIIPLWLFGTGRRLRVSVTPDGNPAVLIEGGEGPGARIDNDHATDPTLTLNNTNVGTNPALEVNGSTACNGSLTVADTFAFVANGACTLGNAAGDVITINGTTTFNAPVTVADGQAFVANGNCTLGNNAAGDTLTVNAAATFLGTAQFNGNVTVGNGVSDTITFTAKAASTLDMDNNILSNVNRMQLSTGVSPSGAAQLAADASGNLLYRPSGTTHYVHSSEKGYIQAWSAAAAGTEMAGAGTELAQVTITPLATGDVLVMASGSLTFPADNNTVLVTLYDTTSNVVVSSQTERSPYTGLPGTRTGSFVIRGIRALPDTAARTFVVTLGAAVNLDYVNLITSVVGVR